jgi:succinate-semialdehyde dehydrogenase/glutarate-semialdehyde dehydrogenase
MPALPAWREQTAKQRSQVLQRWFALINRNTEDLAALMTAEGGKPLAEARGEVAYGASFVEWFAEEGKRAVRRNDSGDRADKRLVVIRQPIGVCAAITPWNFPLAMITRKVAPALAAGCTIVVKPAEETPLTALALAALAEEAGFPAGVFNVLTGDPVADRRPNCCASPVVRKLSFTGSTAVGRLLMAQCAPTVKKLSLELGGNAPFIVFDDADLDAAVEGAMIAKYRNTGQTCVCANRFLVQSGIYEAFARPAGGARRDLKVGNGARGTGVEQGPLINDAALPRSRRWSPTRVERRPRAVRRHPPCARRHLLPADGARRRDAGDAGGARGNLRAGRAALSLRAKARPSAWPTTPNPVSPPICTRAMSPAAGASPKRSNTAWSASIPG